MQSALFETVQFGGVERVLFDFVHLLQQTFTEGLKYGNTSNYTSRLFCIYITTIHSFYVRTSNFWAEAECS